MDNPEKINRVELTGNLETVIEDSMAVVTLHGGTWAVREAKLVEGDTYSVTIVRIADQG